MVEYHSKLINKDMSFYRDNQTGYLTSVFRQYLDGSMELVRFWRGEALGAIISLIAPTIVLLVVSPKVGLVALVVIILQLLYIVWSSSKANRWRDISHEIYRKITGEVSDEITNIVAFKSGGIEDQAHKTIARLAKQETNTFWQRRKATTLFDLPRSITTAVGISLAIYLIINGSNGNDPNTLGLIVLTLTYMFQIIRNVAVLPELMANHDDTVTKVFPTLQYLDNDHEKIRDPQQPIDFAVSGAAIDIDNVDFSYPSHAKNGRMISVFKGLNLHIASGEQLGVVGLSGAGKSTLANLLLRFDDVDSGTIKIDGIDIRDVRQSQLRSKIAYVPQEPLLFHRSIRENIAYYKDQASDDEIKRAAKAAHADEFIQLLPDGYQTTVGERGVKLSGGQKQRVAIARAVLKKAPITLFDEATSALDSESEQIIQRALPQILGKQTAIVVAHRLSTVAGLDRIVVMHEGKIIEEGTHAQLLRRRGRYYSLWQRQTGGSKNPSI
jgi:ATP-binding cassette subfamily B protein